MLGDTFFTESGEKME